jgi:hypothetical protein
MNDFQRVWWEQARSDLSVFTLLRQAAAHPCHHLHYIQMLTEKLGKAYFWRSKKPPRKSHAFFVRFLQALLSRRSVDNERIANLLGFSRAADFENWIPTIAPLAHEVERLAPDLAGDGPNPEYPWPSKIPTEFPAGYTFSVWEQLTETGRGRQLLKVIEAAVREFPKYA